MREPVLLWDYDDTLGGVEIENAARMNFAAYDHVLGKFARQMQIYGFDPKIARTRQNDIDSHLAATLGFGDKGRFAQSFVDTYTAMCADAGISVFQWDIDELRALGHEVFQFPYVALEGALETLDVLSHYYRQVVITKGDTDEQHKKLADSGVGAMVDHIYVLPHKSDSEWEAVIRDLKLSPLRRSTCWAIGNSIKSDLNHCLRMGFNAIHIDTEGWSFEHAEAESPSRFRRFVSVKSVTDVLREVPLPTARLVARS